MPSLKYPYRSFQKVYPQTVDSIRTNGFIINPNNKEIKYNNFLTEESVVAQGFYCMREKLKEKTGCY